MDEGIKCPHDGCDDRDFCYCIKEQMKESRKLKASRGWAMADNFEKELVGIEFKRRQKTFYIGNMKVRPETRELSFKGSEKVYQFGNRKKLVEFIKNQL